QYTFSPILRPLGQQQPVKVRRVVNQLEEVSQPFNRHFIIKPVTERWEDARAVCPSTGGLTMIVPTQSILPKSFSPKPRSSRTPMAHRLLFCPATHRAAESLVVKRLSITV